MLWAQIKHLAETIDHHEQAQRESTNSKEVAGLWYSHTNPPVGHGSPKLQGTHLTKLKIVVKR